jgi:transcriptional regulator with XRE-family HTH domain
MNPVRILRKLARLTQADLAAAAGTSQPTIAAYEAGAKSPTLDTVRRLAEAAGLEMSVAFHSPMVREERRSLHLHRAIARRLADDPAATLQQARRTLALMRKHHPEAGSLLREWAVLLARPVEELIPALTDPSPRGRELRQVTPFAGVLSPAERAEAYRSFEAEEAGP